MKTGYKQTEAGAIPADWDCLFLGELFTFKNGLNKAKAFFGYGTPIVNYMDVFEQRGLLAGDIHGRVSLSKHEIQRFDVRRGDVFFTRTSETAAEVGIASVMLDAPADTVFSGFILRARPKVASLDDQFKKFCFSSSNVRRQITSQSTETTRALTNGRSLAAVAIALPPISEQRVIATALNDVDAQIDAIGQLIAKKRDLKQAAMQQLLTGRRRLPGFRGEWEMKRLGDMGKCLRGVSYRGDSDLSTHDMPHTIRLLRSNNVQDALVVISEVQFVDADRVAALQVLRKDDILICMANGSKALVGKAGLFRINDGYDYTFGAFMGCFRTDKSISNPGFVFSLFQTGRYRNHINNLLAGSSINNLRPSSIECLEFPFPDLPEQAAITEALSDMDDELAALEKRRDKTLALKQGMMQELLTGRTRLV